MADPFISFILMKNHFHLLVSTPLANLSEFMGSVQTRYGVYFNRKHRQSGHVYQGRFKPLLVEENEYLQWLGRYIHLNPVQTKALETATKAERKTALHAYAWSSYPDYARLRKRRPWLSYDLLERQVKGRSGGSRAYRSYIEAGLATSREEWEKEISSARLAFGSTSFVERIRERYEEQLAESSNKQEDITARRTQGRLGTDEVLAITLEVLGIDTEEVGRRRGGGVYRGILARMLLKYSGMTQREVAEYLGMGTGASVSMRLKALNQELGEDQALARKVKQVERRLGAV